MAHAGSTAPGIVLPKSLYTVERGGSSSLVLAATINCRPATRPELYVQCSTWNMANVYVHIQKRRGMTRAHKRRNYGLVRRLLVTSGHYFRLVRPPKSLITHGVKCG